MTAAQPRAAAAPRGSGLLPIVPLLAGLLALVAAAAVPLRWAEQGVVGGIFILLAIAADRLSESYLVTLSLVLLSCFATLRYGLWRAVTVVLFLRGKHTPARALDTVFVGLLLLAELYAFSNLFLGYLQTLWPLRRTPVPMPQDVELWPAVDLLIPTLNEPLHLVKYTALAAMNVDWPADRLHVYLLDDGNREEFRAFCQEAGIGYIARDHHLFAKAGNINHALQQTSSPFVAVFDCDQVPTRSFLQITMGWFGRDPRLGMLQTPHHLYSPDPFERNLKQFRVVPNEGELFYGVIQDGNDFWNATFFCGSCAVLRRSALDEIGGIAVETVTEDAHTSLRMQKRGWRTAYLNIPQAAGLATERLSGHVRQRVRWARGMVQVLRIENPLFARGLTAAQRLCYFNAMSHFLYALPRLIFLTAPAMYLLFGRVSLPGLWVAAVAYAMPHLILANVANSRVQGRYRYSFWGQIYETVLAPYIFFPTLWALLNPRAGRYATTSKGGVVQNSFFDARVAMPFLVLLLLNLLACCSGLLHLLPLRPLLHAPWPINRVTNLLGSLYRGQPQGAVWLNLAWAVFNLMLISVATAVARENLQRRQTVRVSLAISASVLLPDGTLLEGVTTDVSSGGAMIEAQHPLQVHAGESIHLLLPLPDGEASLPATVIQAEGNTLRTRFAALSLREEEALAVVMYSRADTWLHWDDERKADRPLASLLHISRLAAIGLWESLASLARPRKGGRLAQMLGLLLLAGLVCPALAQGIQPFHAPHLRTWTQAGSHGAATLWGFTAVVPLLCVGSAVLLRARLRKRARLRLLGVL